MSANQPNSTARQLRCKVCRYWLWKDGEWHSLDPKPYPPTDTWEWVTCPHCEALQ